MSKFPMKPLCGVIVCLCGIVFVFESTKVMFNTIDFDATTPHSIFFSSPYALEVVTTRMSGMMSILTNSTDSEILESIIKPIKIDMVYSSLVSFSHHKYFSVHKKASGGSGTASWSNSNSSVGVPNSTFASGSPLARVYAFKMSVVNDCYLTFVKHNFHHEPPKRKSTHDTVYVKEEKWLS